MNKEMKYFDYIRDLAEWGIKSTADICEKPQYIKLAKRELIINYLSQWEDGYIDIFIEPSILSKIFALIEMNDDKSNSSLFAISLSLEDLENIIVNELFAQFESKIDDHLEIANILLEDNNLTTIELINEVRLFEMGKAKDKFNEIKKLNQYHQNVINAVFGDRTSDKEQKNQLKSFEYYY